MTRAQDAENGESWLDYRISRRRLFAFSSIAVAGGVLGFKVLNGLSGFRINTAEARTPSFDPVNYRFVVDGLVENAISLTYDELLELPNARQVSDFHCVEGWSVPNVRWQGVRMQAILDIVKPRANAGFITFHALDGVYTDSLAVRHASYPDALIAYRMNDLPLTPDHGHPLRFIMPQMYGYKGTKYLYRLEFVQTQATGYWEQRGWQVDAWIH